MSAITEEQHKIIEAMKCVRISEYDGVLDTDCFCCKRNEGLADYFRNSAMDDDMKEVSACYLVSYPDDSPALYFTLKCGSLFDMNYNKEVFEQKIKDIEDQVADENDIDYEELLRMKIDVFTKRTGLEQDAGLGQKINYVENTYPGIEVVQFCTNDTIRLQEKWKQYNMGHSMGEVMFWRYIVSCILNAVRVVGCQYVYLFAADSSKEEALINYYSDRLKFVISEDLGTNKPSYDWSCRFMCQTIDGLKDKQKDYFSNFNRDEDEVTI